jgi:hypothetical protein
MRVKRKAGPSRQAAAMTSDAPSSIGPAEMILIAFPGNRFDGSILPAVKELVAAGTARIIDLVVVRKDADGTVTALSPLVRVSGEHLSSTGPGSRLSSTSPVLTTS